MPTRSPSLTHPDDLNGEGLGLGGRKLGPQGGKGEHLQGRHQSACISSMVTELQLQDLARLVDASRDLFEVLEFSAHGRDILAREVALDGVMGKDLFTVRQRKDFADPGDLLGLCESRRRIRIGCLSTLENMFSLVLVFIGIVDPRNLRTRGQQERQSSRTGQSRGTDGHRLQRSHLQATVRQSCIASIQHASTARAAGLHRTQGCDPLQDQPSILESTDLSSNNKDQILVGLEWSEEETRTYKSISDCVYHREGHGSRWRPCGEQHRCRQKLGSTVHEQKRSSVGDVCEHSTLTLLGIC